MGVASIGQALDKALFQSGIAQTVLDKSGDASYVARAAARTSTTPADRQLDYWFRDLYMTVVTMYVFEQCFRILDTFYSTPLATQALELNKLGQFARKHFPDRQFSADELRRLNLSTLPNELRKRIVGTQVRDKSFTKVATLLEHDLANKLKNGDLAAEALLRHVYYRMNYPEYLQKYQNLPAETVQTVMQQVETCRVQIQDKVQEELNRRLKIEPGAEKKLLSRLKKNIISLTEDEIGAIKDKVLEGVETVVKDGVDSKLILARMGKMQRSVGWPKIALTLAANVIYFGWLGNWFDITKLQPWQKKITEERGGVKELIGPAYMAMIPGVTVAMGLKFLTDKLPMLRRLDPAGKFAIFGLGGLAAFTAAAYLGITSKLAWLRKNKPVYKPHMPANYNPAAPAPATGANTQSKTVSVSGARFNAALSANTLPAQSTSGLQHRDFQQFFGNA